jgi:hypothetical protein
MRGIALECAGRVIEPKNYRESANKKNLNDMFFDWQGLDR